MRESESILELHFQAYGGNYEISIECASGYDDPRCNNENYILGLANNLSVTGLEGGFSDK